VGEINQVLLNLVVNAAHAIEDVVGAGAERGSIRVRTRCESEHVVITIADTGSGIAQDVADRIFDPFFTTKDVGRGTGQGLALARTIVTERHAGELTFDSEPGVGSSFHVRLPLAGVA
jgi:signal transduction histidine kinase